MFEPSEMPWRGWVEIVRADMDPMTPWHVYDWSEHHDSGSVVGEFALRSDAVRCALRWASKHRRKFEEAEVIDLRKGLE